MPAVVDGQAAGAGVDLGEHRGDELFVRPAAVSLARIQPAGEAGVEPPGHLGQRVDLVGDLAEHAKHVGRDLHRIQPFAPGVADDQPDPELGARDLIQVPADPGLGCGRQVDHPELQRADPPGQRPEQRAPPASATDVTLASFSAAGVTFASFCFPGPLRTAPIALTAATTTTDTVVAIHSSDPRANGASTAAVSS